MIELICGICAICGYVALATWCHDSTQTIPRITCRCGAAWLRDAIILHPSEIARMSEILSTACPGCQVLQSADYADWPDTELGEEH